MTVELEAVATAAADAPVPASAAAAAAVAPSPQEDASKAGESVCVAINIRPLVAAELEEGCKECLTITPGEPQVGHGGHQFRYDHVFGEALGAEPPAALYDRCVAPLVDGLFRGYNATVFAYGQTGSGKTYTMGSAFAPGMASAGAAPRGVIPAVMDAVFERIAAAPPDVDFTVRVGFVEIHKEEIHDLLVTRGGPHPAVHIREVAGGGVCLAGAAEREVRSRAEMVEVLEQGTLLRATAATGMNKQSSRSHAIFTITLEQRRLVGMRGGGGAGAGDADGGDSSDEEEGEEGEGGVDDSYLCAKMHLVDLAGSERAKRTKAVGARLQEGININKGLLALGNVINALSEGKGHVPYRDSKLTRMLQDSLGGNSRTVMIACVSPADVNLEESLNTLRYAARARSIRNTPVVNRDPVAAQLAHMRQQMAALRAENQGLKARLGLDGGAALDLASPADALLRAAVEDLEGSNRGLAAENQRLRVELDAAHDDLREAAEKMIVAQAQRDRLQQRLHALSPEAAAEAAAAAEALAGGQGGGGGDGDVVRAHLERIAELEAEVKRLKQVSRMSGAFAASMRRQSLAPGGGGGGGDLPGSPFPLSPLAQSDGEDELGDTAELSALQLHDDEYVARGQAHSMEVAAMQGQLAQLQRRMDAKLAAMRSMTQHSALRQAYDAKLGELQRERDALDRERSDLLRKLEELKHASEDERLALRAQYEARIRQLDERVKAVRAKERRALELERMKAKAEGACAKLQRDVLAIKQQKVALHRQMEKSAREFGEWKKQRDRELLQLKKQGRLNAAQLQKLEALHSKQQAVLRRKTEEAEAARRRLKEMEDRQQRLAHARPGTAAAAAAAPAAERPFTAPAAGGAAGHPPRPPTGAGVERSAASASAAPGSAAAAATAEQEVQPNAMAPLLRDERSRREWMEAELDAYCSSYELQKVAEGERAQRSECQRKLREVERALAALRNPEWWGAATGLVSPSSASEEKLLARKAALLAQSELHSKAFEAAQARLLEARQAEEARGGVPADAKRWNGVRTVVQARALLKTLFRSASQHKAQAMEAAGAAAGLGDEIELLRLRLDVAETEKCEAAQQVAKLQVLLQQAEERISISDAGAAAAAAAAAATTTPTKQLLPGAAADLPADLPADEGLREAQEILQQLNSLASEETPGTGGVAGPAAAQEEDAEVGQQGGAASEDEVGDEAEDEEDWEESDDDDDDEEEEDDDDDEEEEASSEDEERHVLWDPSLATPARGLKARKAGAARGGGAAGGGEARQQRRRRSSTTSGGGGGLLPEEQPVLAHLNEQLRRQGKEPATRLTVALLKEALRGRTIAGQRWRAGSKKREELVRDYRLMLGLKPDADTPSGPGSAATSAPASAPASARGEGGSGGGAAPGAGFSRLLEHTASSLARCAATLQHAPAAHGGGHGGTGAPASASAPLSARAFGSPLPPAGRSRSSSAGVERDAGATPVGAEGPTPEAAAAAPVEPRQRSGSGGPTSPAAAGARSRALQLADLHRDLSALQERGAVTLGLNPSGASRPTPPIAATAATAALQRIASPPREQQRSGGKPGSPFRRTLALGGWGTTDGATPPAEGAEQRPDSPGRLARLFGRGGAGQGSDGKAAAQPAQQQGEATYDLQQPVQQTPAAGHRGGKAAAVAGAALAAHPLRSSNTHSSTTSEASGSRAGSPRDPDFRIGAGGCGGAAEHHRSRPASSAASPTKLPAGAGGRPRSAGAGGGAGNGAAAAGALRPHTSPRRAPAWRPL